MSFEQESDAAASAWENPMGTRGFEFVEYTAEDTEALGRLFEQLGFAAVGRHRSKAVTHYRQNDIHFIVNAEPESFAQSFARVHGPSVCAIAFSVEDAAAAFDRLVEQGAFPYRGLVGPMELNIPAIRGIGDSLIYLVDRRGDASIYDIDFVPLEVGPSALGPPVGLGQVDHLTHNVFQGRMDHWAGFYERHFNFREIRFFDIEGKLTGLRSRAMTSPCGKIRIPINESSDDKSQIVEYLEAYRGEGIQHIALTTEDIYATVAALRARGVEFMPAPPKAYYDALDERLPGHGEDLARLAESGILIDGAPGGRGGLLLQIFTATVIGPIFFEIIQRKGDEGFGEGNFRALFEAIEEDQIRRGGPRAARFGLAPCRAKALIHRRFRPSSSTRAGIATARKSMRPGGSSSIARRVCCRGGPARLIWTASSDSRLRRRESPTSSDSPAFWRPRPDGASSRFPAWCRTTSSSICWPTGASRPPTGSARPRSSTICRSPMSFTTSSATCRF